MKHVILFADNERAVREYVRQELESQGHDIVLTEDGTQTLEVLNRFVVDLVILDEHMPRCSGLEAAQHIKQRNAKLPVILFTADSNYEGYKGPLVDETVMKSADLGTLKAAIARLLDPGINNSLTTRVMLHSTLLDAEVECG